MAMGIREEIRDLILNHLNKRGQASWSETVAKVSDQVGVHPMYVEKVMGDLIQGKKVERHEAAHGFPKYSVMAGPSAKPPGRIDGKYDDYNQKRLENDANPTKSGTYEADPRKKSINDDTAV